MVREAGILCTMVHSEVTAMPYASNNGVRIHYEVEGKGPPLVLQHGFSGSLRELARLWVRGKTEERL